MEKIALSRFRIASVLFAALVASVAAGSGSAVAQTAARMAQPNLALPSFVPPVNPTGPTSTNPDDKGPVRSLTQPTCPAGYRLSVRGGSVRQCGTCRPGTTMVIHPTTGLQWCATCPAGYSVGVMAMATQMAVACYICPAGTLFNQTRNSCDR